MGISYNTTIVRNGLVLHLDAANPKSYNGSGTVWEDLSGLGNNATLVNGVGYSADNNGAMVFDGTNDYATVPSSPLWAVGSSATMQNWLYFDNNSFTTNHRIWCIRNNGTSLDIGISVSSGYVFTSGSSGFPLTTVAIPKKTWVFLTVRFLSGNLDIFFNDIPQPLSGTTTGINKTNTGTLFLGQFSGGGNYTVQGKISTYGLYNRALTAAEICQNFEATRGRYGI